MSAYHDGLIKLSTIDRAKLPDLKPANAILGLLRPEVAREWGSARRCPGADGFAGCALSRHRVRCGAGL